MIPYPTDKMIMNELFGQYNAGYSAGYDKGFINGRKIGINVGRKEILDKLLYLVRTYDDAVDLAYEVDYLIWCEQNNEEKQDGQND